MKFSRSVMFTLTGVVVLALVGCGAGFGGSMRSKQEIEASLFDATDEIIQVTGLSFPKYDRAEGAGAGISCKSGDESQGKYLGISLRGSPADDSLVLAEKVRAFWESKGWKITRWDTENLSAPNPAVNVSAVSPEGMRFFFVPIKNANGEASENPTRLSARSDCSTDIK